MNLKKIKSELTIKFGLVVIISCLALSFTAYEISKKLIETTAVNMFNSTSSMAAKAVENTIKGNINLMREISDDEELISDNLTIEEKLQWMKRYQEKYNLLDLGISDIKGNMKTISNKEFNISGDSFFKGSMEDKIVVADPFIIENGDKKTMVIAYSAPIKKGKDIVGVVNVCTRANEISELIKEIKFLNTGQAYMINSKGDIIASNNMDLVYKKQNNIELSKDDGKLKKLAEIEKKMINNEDGIGEYVYENTKKYMAYSPVNINGWSIGVYADKSDVLSKMPMLNKVIIGISILSIIIGVVVISAISDKLTKLIKGIENHINLIADGDLSIEIDDKFLKCKNEMGGMARSLKNTQNNIAKIINSIKNGTNVIDNQSGSLAAMSEELTASSENIASSIQNVTSGTVEQAQNLSDIVTMVNEFSSELSNLLGDISQIESMSKEVDERATNSNRDMENVIVSVKKVTESFKDVIDKITNVETKMNSVNEITELINNIAEQTNLLALNAAIEAARAGEAGSGFSVVAEEIRKLAEQSKDSAENITKIIGEVTKDTKNMVGTTKSMRVEIENQREQIDVAIVSFEEISKVIEKMNPKINNTSESAKMIEEKKNTILEKTEAAASISEEVSASSEEIMASVEEMNASTEELSTSSGKLSEMTQDMVDSVNLFKIE